VSDVFRTLFSDADQPFFAAGTPGHWQFDLPGYVAARLEESRVGAIEVLPHDTYADPDRFYSFRRATHRDEPTYGRQLSLIGLA
jgi:copper oxidase (laccase) domain-containing protein